MNVVLTAPRPASMTPSLPRGAAIWLASVTADDYIITPLADLTPAGADHVALSDLFASNYFVRRLTGDPRRFDLTVTMTGVQMGDRLLQLGLADRALLGALGAKIGLSGHVAAIDPRADVVKAARHATERAGVHAEIDAAPFDALPLGAGAFDLVVVADPDLLLDAGGDAAAREMHRVLRPGGRAVAIERHAEPSLVGRWFGRRPAPALDGERLLGVLRGAGFGGARQLADREGLRFYEALKGRS